METTIMQLLVEWSTVLVDDGELYVTLRIDGKTLMLLLCVTNLD